MENLLRAAAVGAMLALVASPALADELVRENRSVNVRAERLDLSLRGTGRISVSGESKLLRARLAGVGSLEAQGLRADAMDLDLSGLGGATVHATRAADVGLSGMGSANVYGNPPTPKVNTSGMGKVAWK